MRPDRKGIKTSGKSDVSIPQKLEMRPDRKGIKTGVDQARLARLAGLEMRPDRKGIKTRKQFGVIFWILLEPESVTSHPPDPSFTR